MRRLQILTAVLFVAGCVAAQAPVFAASAKVEKEGYIPEPMPAGFQVINTELEGNVFADATGHTMYKWPVNNLRNGNAGEGAGIPSCYNVKIRETAGFTSPYPAGNILPDVDNRLTCTQEWPPVYAAADSKPVGNFTILTRTDGTKQWAYKGYALYTSHLDAAPGDTNGGTFRRGRDPVSHGAERDPVGPASEVPPQFAVTSKALGRMLSDAKGPSVYTYDRDTATKSNCVDACLNDWTPIIAPDSVVLKGEWSIVIRPGGERQWAFRGKPLYKYVQDSKVRSYDGADVPGWHNVFLQRAPSAPAGFQVVDTNGGQVLTDRNGKTLYTFNCVEDTADTLYCDNPTSAQEYRWAMCGGGDPARCLKTFPYVVADKNDKSLSRAWTVMEINPKTGRVATGKPDALRVWAYRGRPIYTFVEDKQPGDIIADGWGQDHGARNGFMAFWIRDVFGGNDGGGID